MSGNIKNDDIKKRLDTMIGIMLNKSIQEVPLKKKIMYLSSQGYNNQEIADLLGTTYSTVAKEKSTSKGGKKDE